MYLFSRRGLLTGSPRATMPWATDITEHVRSVTGRDITLWSGGPGYPVGTVVWSTQIDGLGDMQSMTDTLLADEGYLDRLDAGTALFGAPSEDMVRQIVRPPSVEVELDVGGAVVATTAIMMPGHYAETMAWSVDMAGLVEEIGGSPTMFLGDAFGDFGRVTWLIGSTDLAAADAAMVKVESNDEYLKRIGEAGDMFVHGSGTRGIARRIL